MSKKEYKYKPSMTIMTKRGTKVKIDAKGDKLYDSGTRQWENKLTGKKGKKETLWMKRMSPEEFDGKPKIKLKKKSGGYRKVVKK
tara:strand:- start:422 stop:676 length:255 start_codon:yes stop_codon:yes gene_type:complete